MQVGEDEERLAYLYIASSHLHGTLELREVVSVILEIGLNLVGAERMVFYVHDEERAVLVPAFGEGYEALPAEEVPMGEGRVGLAAARQEVAVETGERPTATIPFAVEGRCVGVLSIDGLLPQKDGFTALDLEIFQLLSRQGAAALYGAFLAGAEPRTITADAFRSRLEEGGGRR